MASVAELEAGLISERTKAALAAAKARGVKLGNPNGALRDKQRRNSEAVAAIRLKAQEHAENLRSILDDFSNNDLNSRLDQACPASGTRSHFKIGRQYSGAGSGRRSVQSWFPVFNVLINP
jgi:DNA invertase Pin-like site-specific DNA recombinase